jgi:hypothetical protein
LKRWSAPETYEKILERAAETETDLISGFCNAPRSFRRLRKVEIAPDGVRGLAKKTEELIHFAYTLLTESHPMTCGSFDSDGSQFALVLQPLTVNWAGFGHLTPISLAATGLVCVSRSTVDV